MSTKSSILFKSIELCRENEGKHDLCYHIYHDIHRPKDTVVIEFWCHTCNCRYEFLMDEHLALQLAELIRNGEQK
jgi:hypothetical protein